VVRSGDAAHSAQRLAELGLAHADQAVMAEAQRAVEQIRAVLAGRRGPRVPPPPRPPPEPSKAEREQEKRAEARAERLHLVALTNAGVIIMGVVLGAMVVVLVLVSHH
jgi:hypothetical protein